MAKQLEDRLLTREEAFDRLKKLISEPGVNRIEKCDASITEETAKKVGDLLIYANGIREYIKPVMSKYTEAKLFILAEVFKNYMKPKLN